MVFGVVQTASEIPGGSWTVSWRDLGPRPPFSLVVADVEAGGAQLMRAGAETWLIDAGHTRDVRRVILPLLEWDGVRRLDALCLTHGDAGHYGGAMEVLAGYRPTALFDNAAEDRSSTRRAFRQRVAESGRSIRSLEDGTRMVINETVQVEVLHPPAGFENRHADNKALILLVTTGSGRLLLLSDAGFAALHALRERHPDLRADVVVHGECPPDPVLDPALLLWVEPELVVINRGSAFGDRAMQADWVRALSASGVEVWDQERHGAVFLHWRESGWEARGFYSGEVWTPSATGK